MFIKCLIAEFKKSRRTFYLWLTIISSLLIPGILFLAYVIKPEFFVPFPDTNPWTVLISSAISSISSFLFPFYIIIFISLITQIEHKNNMWKKIFVLPVRKEIYYYSKLSFIVSVIFISLIIFCLGLFLVGLVSGIFHSELGFLNTTPEFGVILESMLHLFVSVLGIIAIQFLISIRFRNFIIPIGIGLFLSITGSILVAVWENAKYFPYSFPQLLQMNSFGMVQMNHYGIFSTAEIVSVLYFILVSILGLFVFMKQRLE